MTVDVEYTKLIEGIKLIELFKHKTEIRDMLRKQLLDLEIALLDDPLTASLKKFVTQEGLRLHAAIRDDMARGDLHSAMENILRLHILNVYENTPPSE